MKLAKRAAALVLAAVLALSLTACSPKEVASNLILKTADLLGLREEGSDDDEADEIVAQPGGEVNFPDGLQDTSVHWNQQVQDGTLYVAFNSIQNRNTEYFCGGFRYRAGNGLWHHRIHRYSGVQGGAVGTFGG